MGRKASLRTPSVSYRGVTIRLYPYRGRWKSTYQFHGKKRQECYGRTEAAARQAAERAIAAQLEPNAVAAGSDEVTARALLHKHGVSLTESARYWLSKHDKPLIEAAVEQVRARWLALRQSTKGFHHARALKMRSSHFEKAFKGRKIASITLQDLVEWQDNLEINFEGRTVRNIHDATKNLFKFARKRGFLDADRLSAMELMDRPAAGKGKKQIFKPDEMQRLLDAAWGLASPAAAALAIAGFAAVRSDELCSTDEDDGPEDQLAWEDFRWKDNYIFIRSEVAKLKAERNAALPANLKKMLKPRAGNGPVCQKSRLDHEYAKIAKAAGLIWKHNAPRHSAITYDMLLATKPAEVANRAGNSVTSIEASYRNRGATMDEAIAWFRLKPRVAWGSVKK